MPGLFGDKNAGSRAATAANEFTQMGIDELMPFLQSGAGQLPGLEAGATVGGLDERIGQLLNSDTFGSLVGGRERAMQGQLAAGGLTRSGAGLEAMASVPQELALQLEGLLTGRSSGLAGMGLGAGGSIANMFGAQGENVSSGIVTDAEAKAGFLGSLAKGIGGIAGAASEAGGLGALASGIFFSDERLKENIVEIAEIGDMKVVEWDWIPQTGNTVIADCPNVGFIAQDVRDKYPEFVGEYAGWLFVDYERLMLKLQDNLNDKIAREAA